MSVGLRALSLAERRKRLHTKSVILDVATSVVFYYAVAAIILDVGALVGWAFHYVAALMDGYADSRNGHMNDAKRCLLFVPKAWLWPWSVVSGIAGAIRRTVKWQIDS